MANNLYGIMAEFDTATELVDAARAVREAGFRKTDAFSPFPLHEIDEALGIKRSVLPYLVFCGGITGLLSGIGLEYFVHVLDYPIIVGGRPHFSLPAFVPPAYELTILFSALTAAFTMLVMNGLPRLYHPLFNVRRFEKASTDGFFLCIESIDSKFELEATRQFLKSLGAASIDEVQP